MFTLTLGALVYEVLAGVFLGPLGLKFMNFLNIDLLQSLTAYVESYRYTMHVYCTSTSDFEKVPCPLDKFFLICWLLHSHQTS
jgi:hypothetical protein